MYSFIVYDVVDNGEFLTFAKLDLLHVQDGAAVTLETVSFSGSTEFMDDTDAVRKAVSYGTAWVEAQTYTLEERIGPYGLEWEREQGERAFAGAFR